MRCAAALLALAAFPALASAADENALSASAAYSYYAMRDQPDFGVGVAAMERGKLRVEGRYGYEGRDAASLFAGWKFDGGGDAVTFSVTPMIGALFNNARG